MNDESFLKILMMNDESFLKILNYSKTIQRLAISFHNPHLFHSNVTKT